MSMSKHGLGRLPAPDERDNAYALRTLTATVPVIPEYRYWDTRYWGDQGRAPHCVGFAWAHWLHLGPVTQPGPAPVVNPNWIYHEAQRHDEWPGEEYAGTSVRAGAKVLQARGFIESYLWARDVETVMDAVLGIGPVVVGTIWTTDMAEPDRNGFVYARGSVLGGHAYVIDGGNRRRWVFRYRNSHGRDYGKGGRGQMEAETLQRLLDADGEACMAVEVRR